MRTNQQEKPMKKLIAIIVIVLAALGVAGVVYAKNND